MAGTEPGERRDPGGSTSKVQLERPPSERYSTTAAASTRSEAGGAGGAAATRRRLVGPLLKAGLAALIGGGILYAVGALIASTAGLLFVAGITGGTVGLLLARAAVPDDRAVPALTRRQATWLAIGLSVAAVVVGAVATWLNALGEGGTLGLIDYQLTTFGPFFPGEAVIAAIAAAWGAGAGPVEG
jgi:hypothetical protein